MMMMMMMMMMMIDDDDDDDDDEEEDDDDVDGPDYGADFDEDDYDNNSVQVLDKLNSPSNTSMININDL